MTLTASEKANDMYKLVSHWPEDADLSSDWRRAKLQVFVTNYMTYLSKRPKEIDADAEAVDDASATRMIEIICTKKAWPTVRYGWGEF